MASVNWTGFGREIIPDNRGGVCPQQLVMPEFSSCIPKVPRMYQAGSIHTYNV